MADKEIRKARLRLIDLIKSFFSGEPDAEKISRWRGTFSALSRESVNPEFDRGVREILDFLQEKKLKELQDEFYKLFVDPFTDKGLCMVASFYLDGRTHDKTLVKLRSFLQEQQIVKSDGVTDTEDSLVVMLDVLTRLIEYEKVTEESSGQPQEELLHTYLIPFAAKLREACEKNEFADFYKACCRFFCGYLELERGLAGAVA